MGKSLIQYILGITVLLLPAWGHAQRTLGGTVKDEKGKGIAYARIMVKNTTNGTVTDTTGHFSLKTKTAGPDTLVISYLGYQTKTMPIDAAGDQTGLVIGMREVESTVNDVVIMAGTIEASNESAVAVLKPLDIVTTAGGQGDIIGAIQTLPGVQRNGGDQTGLMVRGGDVSEAAVIVDGTIAQNAFGSSVPGVSQRSRFNPFSFQGNGLQLRRIQRALWAGDVVGAGPADDRCRGQKQSELDGDDGGTGLVGCKEI